MARMTRETKVDQNSIQLVPLHGTLVCVCACVCVCVCVYMSVLLSSAHIFVTHVRSHVEVLGESYLLVHLTTKHAVVVKPTRQVKESVTQTLSTQTTAVLKLQLQKV